MGVTEPFVCGDCRTLQENWNRPCRHAELFDVLVCCDSELSAQSHGRPASAKDELSCLSRRCRKIYEGMKVSRNSTPMPIRIAEAIERHFGSCICIEGYDSGEASRVIARVMNESEANS